MLHCQQPQSKTGVVTTGIQAQKKGATPDHSGAALSVDDGKCANSTTFASAISIVRALARLYRQNFMTLLLFASTWRFSPAVHRSSKPASGWTVRTQEHSVGSAVAQLAIQLVISKTSNIFIDFQRIP